MQLSAAKRLTTFTLLLATITSVTAEKNKFYYMESLCKNHFLQQLYRKLEGGVIWSKNERNLDCTITFQTHSILQRFMLHFDLLQLDCNDHLLVYDGAHVGNSPKADLSCRNTKQSVGAIFTRGNFVTLKYTTDNWGTDANGFKLIITGVKDPKHGCKEFRCGQREFCISADLTCDGVDHCADGTDEGDTASCFGDKKSSLFGIKTTWLVVAAAIVLLTGMAVIAAVCCFFKMHNGKRRRNEHIVHMSNNDGSERNGGAAKCMSDSIQLTEMTKLPGNWLHPAGPQRGYSARLDLLRLRA